jgi:hypothetical protein
VLFTFYKEIPYFIHNIRVVTINICPTDSDEVLIFCWLLAEEFLMFGSCDILISCSRMTGWPEIKISAVMCYITAVIIISCEEQC